MSASRWKWCHGALILVVLAGDLSGVTYKSSSGKRTERHATRVGSVIQVHPTEVEFQIPEPWMGQDTLFRLTQRGLHKASAHLWGATIADAALNLRDCAAQVEANNLTWIRAYIVDWPEEKILRRIQQKARAAVKEMPNYAPGSISRGFQTEAAKEGPWQHIDVPYGLNFGDYNSGGFVSFYIRPVSGRQLVIVVSYFGTGIRSTAEREDVLQSVIIPDKISEPKH